MKPLDVPRGQAYGRITFNPGLAALRSRMSRWCLRRRTRGHLRDLETWRLDDVGLTEAQRLAECARWFWR